MLVPAIIVATTLLGRERTRALARKSVGMALGPKHADGPIGNAAAGAAELGVAALAFRKMPLRLAAAAAAKLAAERALADPDRARDLISRTVTDAAAHPAGRRLREYAASRVRRLRGAVGGDPEGAPDRERHTTRCSSPTD
jgi:hypothetical protein